MGRLLVGFALLAACAQASDVSGDAVGRVEHLVTIAPTGTGTGRVLSMPAGIDCGADCSEAFVEGTAVTVRAAADGGSTFVGWTGDVCSGTDDCTVSTTGDQTIGAMFLRDPRTLTVAAAGNGAGTVTSTPAGIDCGSTCAASFDSGAMVTLTAAASTGSTFTGWTGGGCSGTGTCVITLTAATQVTATFTLETYTLTVIKVGTGTVTSNPAGISCGGDCTEPYDYGTSVVLTPVAGGGWSFAGWSGACTGTGTCTVSMTAAKSVTATFSGGFSCTTVSNASTCSNGAIPERNLGMIGSTACHDQCQVQMPAAGMTSGCWIVPLNNNCYCRSGTLTTGGTSFGGTCN